MRADSDVFPATIPTSGVNFNGWEGSLEGKFLPWIGVVADFGGNCGSAQSTPIPSGSSRGRSYVFAVRPGAELPAIPPGGIKSEADLAKLGATAQAASKADDVAPGPSPAIYAFTQRTIQRNLYRVPLP
jgi:hypothetical protein